MNNGTYILIAEEQAPDMFNSNNDTPVLFEDIEPQQETLPELPATEVQQQTPQTTEPQNNTYQLAVYASVIIIVLILIAFIIKRLFQTPKVIENDDYTSSDDTENTRITENINEALKKEPKSRPSKLTTSSSIKKCIMSFLEITKEN